MGYNLENERYKIAAMLDEEFLWEYSITEKTLYIFDGCIQIPDELKRVENFRYNRVLLSYICLEDMEKFLDFCTEIDSGNEKISTEVRILTSMGEYKWYCIEGKILSDEVGIPYKVIGRMRDVDKQKKERQKLKEKSEKDQLTSLYNKVTTEKKISRRLRKEENDEYIENTGALMLIDFDDFKKLNDNLGHLFGDSVLRDVTSKLHDVFRSGDVVGRVGGDEFVAFVSGKCTEETIKQKAECVNEIFNNLYNDADGKSITSCSIGVALAPKHGRTYKELFKKADMALYHVKSKGKGCYQIYNEDISTLVTRQEELYYTYDSKDKESSKRKYSVDETLPRIFKMLFNSVKIEDGLNKAIKITGEEYSFGKVHIMALDSSKKLTNRFEWCLNKDVYRKNKNYTSDDIDYKEWRELFQADGTFFCNRIEELKEVSQTAYLYFKQRKVQSFLQCAFFEEGSFAGIISFEDYSEPRILKKRQMSSLINIGRLMGAYYLRWQTICRYNENRNLLREITENQNIVSYLLKPNSYEMIYIDENLQKLYPTAKVGDLCYERLLNSDSPCEKCPLYAIGDKKSSNIIDFYNPVKDMRLKATATKVTWENKEAVLVCCAEVTDFIEIIQGRDELTGLMTLHKFEKEAVRLLTGKEKYVVLSIDIDKFKNVNSMLGYQEGNQILISVVKIISDKLNGKELFCRSNADKFLIMLLYQNYELTLKRIHVLIESVTNYLKVIYPNMHIVISAGAYIATEEEEDVSQAIDKATIARKSIKGNHSGRVAIYDNQIHEKVVKEKEVENHMMSALNNDEFIVYLQPKVDLKTKKVIGAEALVRWKFLNGDIIQPNEFIPIFEKNGFISKMDFYVYEKVFEKMREWIRNGETMIPISINMSRIHIFDKNFVYKLKKLIHKYNIPPELVELEITESVFLCDTEPLLDIINELKQVGFCLSIDDFGFGYSSLNLLRQLNMDVLKLDKNFFGSGQITKKENIVLVHVVKMAKELGMIVLSEGVETKEQVEYLISIGCDLAQGYYFAKPMPMDEFVLCK